MRRREGGERKGGGRWPDREKPPYPTKCIRPTTSISGSIHLICQAPAPSFSPPSCRTVSFFSHLMKIRVASVHNPRGVGLRMTDSILHCLCRAEILCAPFSA